MSQFTGIIGSKKKILMIILSFVTLLIKIFALIQIITKSIIARLMMQGITGQSFIPRSQPAKVVGFLNKNNGLV